MLLFLKIFVSCLFLFMGYLFYLLWRNSKVRTFLLKTVDVIFVGDNKTIKEEFSKTVTEGFYQRMVFSFKPLKVEKWFSKEFIEEYNKLKK